MYELIGDELVYRQTLESSFQQFTDNYGVSIAADGTHLVVGSLYNGHPGRDDRPGAVFVYELEDGLWEETAVIEPPADAYEFGITVALHDGLLAVSDNYRGFLDVVPRVLVYEAIGSDWELRDIVTMPDGVSRDSRFGLALALDGERLVVGAPDDGAILSGGGSTHIYTRGMDGTHELDQSLRVDGRERLGTSVVLDGPRVLVGAPNAIRDFDYQGVVYQYVLEDSRWVLSDEIRSDQPGRRHSFGFTMARHGDRLFVQSPRDRAGSVQGIERSPGGEWRQFSHIVPDTTALALRFGHSMATDNRFLLIGAPEERERSVPIGDPYGAAYLFDLACNACPPDLDDDGTLTIFDFLTFANLFDAGSSEADFDADGELTIFDFLAFQAAFDAGCE